MDKNYLEDIVPPAKRRSIRDIPLPSRSPNKRRPTQKRNIKSSDQHKPQNHKSSSTPVTTIPPQDPEDDFFFDDTPRRPSRLKVYSIISGIVVIVIALFFVLSNFDSAVVTVTPKRESSAVDAKVSIHNMTNKSDEDSLGYRIIEVDKEVNVRVDSDSEEFVQSKASGVITVYNEYSTQPQNLINNTRFQSESGKIYRIQKSISVPGYTESNGEIIPGTLDVTVVADEVGEEYNISETTFVIPGFKGQEPYDFFHAETKTEISDGYDGTRKVVSEEKINTASSDLRNDLTAALVDELNSRVSNEFISIYDNNSFTYGEIKQEDASNGDEVILTMRGSIVARIFDRISVSNAVAKGALNDYATQQNVLISNLDDASISVGNQDVIVGTNEDGDEIVQSVETLAVAGNLEFVWQNDNDALKKALLGQKKSDLGTVLQGFKGITLAEAVIKPFWRSSFPDDSENITIDTN